ncbi:MAG: hypothetical protein K2X47_00875 [Bdellovibrionales bacterium]|nr:hypothetical protein [Bdellovibrionales bacterium]
MNSRSVANKILKAHGILLVLLGLSNAVASFVATKTEIRGPFQFLYQNPFPEVGFLQAYLLAALVGATLFLGSKTEEFYIFDVVGIVMHLIPPTALILMYDQINQVMGPSTIKLSISIHASFVTLELIALILYFRGGKRSAVA